MIDIQLVCLRDVSFRGILVLGNLIVFLWRIMNNLAPHILRNQGILS